MVPGWQVGQVLLSRNKMVLILFKSSSKSFKVGYLHLEAIGETLYIDKALVPVVKTRSRAQVATKETICLPLGGRFPDLRSLTHRRLSLPVVVRNKFEITRIRQNSL